MQDKIVKKYAFSSVGICIVALFMVYSLYEVMKYCGMGDNMQYAQKALLFGCFFVLWVYSIWYVKRLCRQIDVACDVFEEILEDSAKEDAERVSNEEWARKLSHSRSEGAIGRLENQLLESVHVFGQREISNQKEQRYLKKMMTDISHQIKTPLAALQVFLEIFQQHFERQAADQELLDMVVQARNQTMRIHQLVIGLLKLTQLESGMLVLQKEKVNLRAMLQECIQMVQANYMEKQLRFAVLGDADVNVYCDREWTEEAIGNLLKNAGEYSKVAGHIDVSWTASEMAVILKITDHGPGIERKDLPKIFNRFYRVHRAEASSDGVGIGLALAKEIIEQQNGMLTVESCTNEPSYTSFEVVFLTKM